MLCSVRPHDARAALAHIMVGTFSIQFLRGRERKLRRPSYCRSAAGASVLGVQIDHQLPLKAGGIHFSKCAPEPARESNRFGKEFSTLTLGWVARIRTCKCH